MANIENEIDNAFKVVGIFVNATALCYRKDGKEQEASELEQAFNVLNKHFGNKFNILKEN